MTQMIILQFPPDLETKNKVSDLVINTINSPTASLSDKFS